MAMRQWLFDGRVVASFLLAPEIVVLRRQGDCYLLTQQFEIYGMRHCEMTRIIGMERIP